jgi:hypothetical protein
MRFPFQQSSSSALLRSQLFNEKTFYRAFSDDLRKCKEEVIIESPFITTYRMKSIMPIFNDLLDRKVRIYVITRDPKEHDETIRSQAELAIRQFETTGVPTLLSPGNHHRKLAILDRKILWEGSLNILSNIYSREIMRRIESSELAMQMFYFLRLDEVI